MEISPKLFKIYVAAYWNLSKTMISAEPVLQSDPKLHFAEMYLYIFKYSIH